MGRKEAEMRAWKESSNDPEEIKEKYAAIKPKYETHRERVKNVNQNVDELMRTVLDRKKQFNKMRAYVREQLSVQFKLIMKAQGHDGALSVDYETNKLEMR